MRKLRDGPDRKEYAIAAGDAYHLLLRVVGNRQRSYRKFRSRAKRYGQEWDCSACF